MSRLDRYHSSCRARSPCMSLPTRVPYCRCGLNRLATCMVMVEAPETIRPAVRFCQPARTNEGIDVNAYMPIKALVFKLEQRRHQIWRDVVGAAGKPPIFIGGQTGS